MVGDSPNYHEGGPPQGAQKLPPIRRENDCDIGGSTASWREIFAVDGAGAGSISPTLGVNFMRAAQNTRTIKYSLAACRGGSSKDSCSEYATLTLGQDLRNLGLGAVVWDCGKDLAAFLGRNRHLVVGTKVLDLGTGTGIAGLAAARCGARQVTLTDHAALGPLVRSNVERNVPGFAACCSRPTFIPFSWDNHTPAEVMELATPDDPFDIVLASDCLYDSAMLAGFRKALAATCSPRTVLLMAYKRRLDCRETKFFEQLEEDFHLEVADARRGEEPLSTSNDLGMESASDGIAAERDVYLLLGARRGNRTEKDGYSPLEKWRRILHVERDTQILG